MPQIESVDDLSHDWTTDVLRYEQTWVLGLTTYQALIVAAPFIVLMLAQAWVLAIFGSVAAYALIREFKFLGHRTLGMYLLERLFYRPHEITLPLVLPAGSGAALLRDWDDSVMMAVGQDFVWEVAPDAAAEVKDER